MLDPGYNALAHRSSLTTPSQTIAYNPDAWGRPTQLGSWASSVSYHANGLLSAYGLGNGLSHSQTLDTRQRPLLQTTLDGTSVIQKYQYAYNNSSDLLSLDDQGDGSDDASFAYDGHAKRIKTVKVEP